MQISPTLRALRGDAASQRQAQAAFAALRECWRGEPHVEPVLQAFDAFDRGASLERCDALARVMTTPAAAAMLLDPLVRTAAATLRRHPLGHFPFRHQLCEGHALIQLASGTRSALALALYTELPDAEPPRTLCFVADERHEIVLAGRARIRIVRRTGPEAQADLDSEWIAFDPGSQLSLDGSASTRIVESVARPLVALRLSRAPLHAEPAREYALDDGRLVHRAAGDAQESRREMAMAVLGAMQRKDAAPAIAALAHRGSDAFRWQAVRECLALDTARGFRTLDAIARDSEDPLAGMAGALRAQLIEAHPVLKDLACPA